MICERRRLYARFFFGQYRKRSMEDKKGFHKVVSLMLDTTYYDALEYRSEHHQRKKEDIFSDFTYKEMMYYYIHQ